MGVLTGKAVVITGAGAGLGRAYALAAAAQGAGVVVNDVDAEGADEVTGEILAAGGQAVAAAQSVTGWDDSRSVIDSCLRAYGQIDGLVNNAGVLTLSNPWEADELSIRRTVEVNVVGSLFMGTHALEVMVAQGHGSIVNITSSAQLGLPMMAAYSATKGALASLTYSWALDGARYDVRVNAYSPVASTAMTDMSPVVPPDLPSPEDNAAAVVYLLSDLSHGITGQVIQRRGDRLILMSHPDFTQHTARADAWTLEAIEGLFDPVLRKHLQPVGLALTKSS